MDKLTKEQVTMFTIIGVVVMLIAFFFVKIMGDAPIGLIGERYVGWFGKITLILALLAPIYTCLYAFRNEKVLEPLKPIFVLSPGLAFALPLIALGLCLFASFFDGGWAVILYAIGAAAVFYIGQNSK